jgi:hypothetical protein
MNGFIDDAERYRRRFERRAKAAKEGRHLPTLDELLLRSPFLGDDIATDAQAYAERMLPRVADDALGGRLKVALQALTVSPDIDDFRAARIALQEAYESGTPKRLPAPGSGALRCALYAAHSGCRESAWYVAAKALSLAFKNGTPAVDVQICTKMAFGWLLTAAAELPSDEKRDLGLEGAWGPVESHAQRLGEKMFDRLVGSLEVRTTAPKETKAARNQMFDFLGIEVEVDEAEAAEAPDEKPPGLVVVSDIGNRETSEGKRVVREFESLVGVGLPLAPTPDLTAVRRTLAAEFPHANDVMNSILTPLSTSPHLRFRPIIFVGEPGCGKTAFAERLFEMLAVQSETYPCGGISDPALAGTPRRWSTGEPSLPVTLARRWSTATPGIILDEIEKVATSRHNGNLLDALLALLEPRSSSAWHDPYIEASVNLSGVLWLGTANSLDGIPGPLRDRCRIVPFPDPGPEHLEPLAAALMRKAAADQGLDTRWFRPLDGEELGTLRHYWKGGSIRRLARLLEGILAVREQNQRTH